MGHHLYSDGPWQGMTVAHKPNLACFLLLQHCLGRHSVCPFYYYYYYYYYIIIIIYYLCSFSAPTAELSHCETVLGSHGAKTNYSLVLHRKHLQPLLY